MAVEGYTKFECNFRQATLQPGLDLAELIELRSWLHGAGLVGVLPDGVGFGNVSRRSAPIGQFVISGTQTGQLPRLSRSHFALVESYNIGRNELNCCGEIAASSESLSHAAVYSGSEITHWVAHVHHAKFFAVHLGALPTTDKKFEYGTPEIAFAILELAEKFEVAEKGCILMGGHTDGIIFFAETAHGLRERIIAAGLAEH